LNGYPMMRASGWIGSEDSPSFPGVIIKYIGFKSGTVPPVKIVDGVTSQSASGSGLDNSTEPPREVSGTFLYRASRTSYTWFETSTPPPYSRYQTVRFPIDPLSQIDSYSIQDSGGSSVHNVPYSAFITILNSMIRKVIVSNYEREELVPGLLWGCQADVDFRVVN